jgi:SAM-dependent methyltransferase
MRNALSPLIKTVVSRGSGATMNSLRNRGAVRAVHDTATKGFTADSASSYESGRPSYTTESLDRIIEVVFAAKPDSDEAKVLELGAGTGKFTKSLLEYVSKPGVADLYPVLYNLQYIATEPSSGFRDALMNNVKLLKGNIKVDTAVGNSIPAESNTLDAVIAAQAFHWMANVDTLKEVHRVLVPYSPLVMIWNSYDYSYDWLKQIDEKILTPAYGEGVPRQQNGKWEECFQTDEGRSLFSMVQKWQGQNIHQGNLDMVVNRVLSTSVIVEKTEAERAEVEKIVRDILATHPELAEARRTNKYEISYITELAWVVKH